MNNKLKSLKQLNEQLKNIDTCSFAGFNLKYPVLYAQIVETTSFLPQHSNLNRRIWHIKNETMDIPMCPICHINACRWNNHTKPVDGKYCAVYEYSLTCSTSCSNKVEGFQQKAKDAFFEKYKTTNAMFIDRFVKKQQQTIIDRYGSLENLYKQQLQTREKTNIKKYGVKNVMFNDNIKDMHKQSISNSIIIPIEEIIRDYTINRLTAYDIAIKYNINRSSVDKMLKDSNLKYFNRGQLPLETIKILNSKTELEELQPKYKQSIATIAEKLKIEKSTLYKHLKNLGIPTKSYFIKSQQQKNVESFIQDTLPNINIITNTRRVIAPYEIDIYIPDKKLAIEYCGLYWHSTIHKRISKNYHKQKLDACNKQGIRLITIFEDEWVHKQNIVKSKLLSILNKDDRQKVFARKCKIEQVTTKQKQHFFDQFHIQGDGPGSINLALKYKNEIIACMSFIKQKNGIFVLNRYVTSQHVVGGFSKLLLHFKQNYLWKQIISFADLRWSEGNVYEKCGFTLDKTLPPDYYYVDILNTKRIHKFNFRHKNLRNILDNYDPTLSESENTEINNWFKIYNCGLNRYILNKEKQATKK